MSDSLKPQDIIDNKLLEDRKVFLWGMVNDDSAKHVIDRLLYLDALETKDIQLYINSPGGYVTSGFAMYDCIKSLNSDVSTICTGLAGFFLLGGLANSGRVYLMTASGKIYLLYIFWV